MANDCIGIAVVDDILKFLLLFFFKGLSSTMGDMKRNNEHTDNDIIDIHPLGQTDTLWKGTRSLDEIVASLKKEKSLLDKVGAPGNEYEVETTISVNNREWCFSSLAKHNGQEITDDIKLIRDEFCRKRVTQANKTKALWNLFVKEAAEIHLEKCNEIQDRFKGTEKKAWALKKQVVSILGLIVFASGCLGLYMFFYPQPPVKPIVSVPDQTDYPPPITPISLTLDRIEPLLPMAPAEPAREQPDAQPDQPQTPPVLTPEEIRERVSSVLKNKSASP